MKLGRLGEDLAADWLLGRGFRIVSRNHSVQRGEVDLIVDDGAPLVVEVRSTTGRADPIDAISAGKRRRVRILANRLGIPRVAYLGVGLHSWGVEMHWVPE